MFLVLGYLLAVLMVLICRLLTCYLRFTRLCIAQSANKSQILLFGLICLKMPLIVNVSPMVKVRLCEKTLAQPFLRDHWRESTKQKKTRRHFYYLVDTKVINEMNLNEIKLRQAIGENLQLINTICLSVAFNYKNML